MTIQNKTVSEIIAELKEHGYRIHPFATHIEVYTENFSLQERFRKESDFLKWADVQFHKLTYSL